jgi:hypothetical protein
VVGGWGAEEVALVGGIAEEVEEVGYLACCWAFLGGEGCCR